MNFASMNYLAIIAAAIAGFAIGAVWYTVLSQQWMAALGKTREILAAEQKAAGLPFIFPFVLSAIAVLVMAFVLSALMHLPGIWPPTLVDGLLWGAFVWFGFVLTTMAVNAGYSGWRPALLVIDAAHWLLVLLVMGAILALWQ